MANIIIPNRARDRMTSRELEDFEQPLDKKTGYSNPRFDKLYPKTRNPYEGSERDRAKRKKYY